MFKTLNDETLSSRVSRELIRSIVAARFTPGDLLPSEGQLCSEFGVSRSVVREAMKAVTGVGMARSRQGQGTVVLPPSSWNNFAADVIFFATQVEALHKRCTAGRAGYVRQRQHESVALTCPGWCLDGAAGWWHDCSSSVLGRSSERRKTMPKLGIAPIRRQEVIDAVLHIVSTEGWDSLTVRHISALSGVAAGAIPHFLGTKADMVSEAIDYGYRVYQQRVMDAIAAASTPRAKLVAWLDATVSPTADSDEEWGFWLAMWGHIPFDESIRTRLAPVYRVHSAELAAVVEAGVEAGDFAAGVDSGMFADQLVAVVDGLVMRCRLDSTILVSYVRSAVVQFMNRELGLGSSIIDLAAWDEHPSSAGQLRKGSSGGSG